MRGSDTRVHTHTSRDIRARFHRSVTATTHPRRAVVATGVADGLALAVQSALASACTAEDVMKKLMSKISIKTALGIAVAAAGLSLAAASTARAEETIVAHVPFPFVVGAVHFPAGAYIVKEEEAGAGVLQIVSADGRYSTFVLSVPESEAQAPDAPELRFVKSGLGYVLADVVPLDGDPRDVRLTPAPAPRPTA